MSQPVTQQSCWVRPISDSTDQILSQGGVVCIIYSNHLFRRLISWVWLSGPTQRSDSAAWQLTGKDHSCADRESNPGQMLGRHLCYHYTIGAVEGQGLNLGPHASTVNRTRGLKIFSLALSQLSYRSWSNYTHSTTYNVIQIGNNHLISPKRKKTWNFFMGFCTLFWYSQF